MDNYIKNGDSAVLNALVLKLRLDLEDAGITSCKCSFANSTLEVNQEHNEAEVVEIVKKSGYSIKIN